MIDCNILVVGGSKVGLLVMIEPNINVSSYEIVYPDSSTPAPPVTLSILGFTEEQNLVPGKSYNLYPILHVANSEVKDFVFTIAGNQTAIWDYKADQLNSSLPDTPDHARCFPSSSTSVLLPLKYPDYEPTVLLCDVSSGDMPTPLTLDDCWTIKPLDQVPTRTRDDD